MKIMKVNRQTHQATFGKCKNMGQLISAIEIEGERENIFVTKILLNGNPMDHEEENLLDSLSVNEVQELEFHFSSVEEMVRQSLVDIISSIQTTQTTAIQFAGEFRKGQKIDDEKLKFILIECRTIIESLEEVFLVHKQDKFLIKHSALWNQAEKELTNILQCILQSRKISQIEFISDLVEYDLIHALDQWEDALEKELIDNPAFTGIFNLNSSHLKRDNGADA